MVSIVNFLLLLLLLLLCAIIKWHRPDPTFRRICKVSTMLVLRCTTFVQYLPTRLSSCLFLKDPRTAKYNTNPILFILAGKNDRHDPVYRDLFSNIRLTV